MITNVGQLRKALERYLDNALIISQTIGVEGDVWNMFLEVAHGEECGFKWDIQPVIITLSHPQLKSLPKFTTIWHFATDMVIVTTT